MTVPWARFLTFSDGQPKFSAVWLLHPANVVSCFPGEPNQYCRLCDCCFVGVAVEHVAGHASELAAWRESRKSMDVAAPPDFPLNHAGKNGRDTGKAATRGVQVESDDFPASCPHRLSEEDRRKAKSPAARKRRKQTFESKTEARRAEAWKLYEHGLVPSAIADQFGISDRTLRRYLG